MTAPSRAILLWQIPGSGFSGWSLFARQVVEARASGGAAPLEAALERGRGRRCHVNYTMHASGNWPSISDHVELSHAGDSRRCCQCQIQGRPRIAAVAAEDQLVTQRRVTVSLPVTLDNSKRRHRS